MSENTYEDKLLTDLFAAYYQARSNKRNTANQMRFERNLSFNLVKLYEDIVERRYNVGRSICFIIERPVKREVFAASFRDRVVHHLLYNYLMPIFEPTFIYDSYSCREGKGNLFGVERLEHHIRSVSRNFTGPCWVLKMDIQGYFMSMNREKLYSIIIQTLERKGLAQGQEYSTMEYLLRKVIFNDPTTGCYVKGNLSDWDGLPPSKSLFHTAPGCGLPIGNLTSQLFSNIYLNELDQFVKRTLGCEHYGRYVDDFYIVDSSREKLYSCVEPVREFLAARLALRLHPHKVLLIPQMPYDKQAITFLGFRINGSLRRLSHRSRKMMGSNLGECYAHETNWYRRRAVVDSYKGFLGQCRPEAVRLAPAAMAS